MRVELTDGEHILMFHELRPTMQGSLWLTGKSIDGWYGAKGAGEEPVSRPQSDGAYWPSRLTAGTRTVTIHAAAICRSSIHLAQLRDRLNAMACRSLAMAVEDEHGRRTSECYISDDIEPAIVPGRRIATFDIVLTCPDPLKYGPEQSFQAMASACVVVNAGNAPTWPRIQVTGPVKTLKIRLSDTDEDGLVVWQGDGKDGLDLDFRDMIPSRGTVTDDHAFPIPPGTHRLTVETGNVDAKAVVMLRPAWR